MVLIYSESDESSRGTLWLYRDRFPSRVYPSRSSYTRVIKMCKKIGSIEKRKPIRTKTATNEIDETNISTAVVINTYVSMYIQGSLNAQVVSAKAVFYKFYTAISAIPFTSLFTSNCMESILKIGCNFVNEDYTNFVTIIHFLEKFFLSMKPHKSWSNWYNKYALLIYWKSAMVKRNWKIKILVN